MPDISTMTERELYNLSWEISEELVEREQSRLCAEVASRTIVGRYEIARPTPKTVDTSFPGYSVKV